MIYRKLRDKSGEQPQERLSDAAHFTYLDIDIFVLFVTTKRRKDLKRYGSTFTCHAIQAISCAFNGHRFLYHVFKKIYSM